MDGKGCGTQGPSRYSRDAKLECSYANILYSIVKLVSRDTAGSQSTYGWRLCAVCLGYRFRIGGIIDGSQAFINTQYLQL